MNSCNVVIVLLVSHGLAVTFEQVGGLTIVFAGCAWPCHCVCERAQLSSCSQARAVSLTHTRTRAAYHYLGWHGQPSTTSAFVDGLAIAIWYPNLDNNKLEFDDAKIHNQLQANCDFVVSVPWMETK